jgi:hypothetical protein
LQDQVNNFLVNTPYAYFAFFVILWCFISLIISFVGGWHALSRRFRAQSEPLGDTRTAGPFFYGVQMKFRLGYNNVIRITAAEDALYFSILFLLRIGHPPLCIPWKGIQFGRAKFLWLRYIVLTLGEQERIPMRISQRMARKLGILERLPNSEVQTAL